MTHNELQNNSSDAGTKVPMTHDELLAKINPDWDEYVDNSKFRDALRAVVELHKPYSDEGTLMCSYCDWNSYPCGTIEAIEKELN